MVQSTKTVAHGVAGGVTITCDLSRIETGLTKKVQLSTAYTTNCGPGIPTRPCFTGTSAANLDYPRTIASGTILTLHAHEADALVTAGAASYHA